MKRINSFSKLVRDRHCIIWVSNYINEKVKKESGRMRRGREEREKDRERKPGKG